jgi:hypothetical protein
MAQDTVTTPDTAINVTNHSFFIAVQPRIGTTSIKQWQF